MKEVAESILKRISELGDGRTDTTTCFGQSVFWVLAQGDAEIVEHLERYLTGYRIGWTDIPDWQIVLKYGGPVADVTKFFSQAEPVVAEKRRMAQFIRDDVADCYYLREHGTVLVLDRQNRCITVHSSTLGRAKQWAHKIVRHVMTALMINSGATLAHGAALKRGDTGVVFLGPSGSGKTTMLLRFTNTFTSDFVSGDKVLLKSTARGIEVYPWPTALRLDPRTNSCFPNGNGLSRTDGSRSYGQRKLTIPYVTSSLGGMKSSDKCLAQLTFFPRYREAAQVSVRRADQQGLYRRLIDSRLFMGGELVDDWLGLTESIEPWRGAHWRQICNRLATEVPGFSVEGDFVANDPGLRQIVDFGPVA